VSERCVDANIAVKWAVKGEPFRIKARAFLVDAGNLNITLIAPPIFPSEVDSAVRKHVVTGMLTPAQARTAFQILDGVPVQIIEVSGMRQRARHIAERFNQRAVYDATYAALAELRGCEFWTADKAFYNAVKRSLKFVKYLPNYP
jgi:predicted nucleic acid-binding protein